MVSQERIYPYRAKLIPTVLGALFFAVCAGVLGAKAITNQVGLVIKRTVELDASQATIFYWVLTAVSLAFVGLAVLAGVQRFSSSRFLRLGPSSLLVPVSQWSTTLREIPYEQIVGLKIQSVNGQRFLTITHQQGKVVVIASMLPRSRDFDEIVEYIQTQL